MKGKIVVAGTRLDETGQLFTALVSKSGKTRLIVFIRADGSGHITLENDTQRVFNPDPELGPVRVEFGKE